jgi:hypothetical protein
MNRLRYYTMKNFVTDTASLVTSIEIKQTEYQDYDEVQTYSNKKARTKV